MSKRLIIGLAIAFLAFIGILGVYKLNTGAVEANNRYKNKNKPTVTSTPTPSSAVTPTTRPTFTPTPILTIKPTPTTTLPPTATLSPTGAPTATPPPTTVTQKWGAYVGWQVFDVTTFETKIGRSMNYLATFVHWGNEKEFPVDLGALAKAGGKTLIIFWEAMDYNFNGPNDSRFSYDAILRGDWDSYLAAFKEEVSAYGSPVILVLFEEMNGNWYPWSITQNNNSGQKHVDAFRHVKNIFNGVANAKFAWDINCLSEPDATANQIENFYPGAGYVDYVGVNGFNFGEPWQTYHEIFDSALQKLTAYAKPVVIFSMSCAPGPQKAAWITDTLAEIKKNPAIVGWSWFNENKEKDWRVWSDAASLEAFKQGL